MLSISRSIETTFLYIANVLFSLVRNNPYCIFLVCISRFPQMGFQDTLKSILMQLCQTAS